MRARGPVQFDSVFISVSNPVSVARQYTTICSNAESNGIGPPCARAQSVSVVGFDGEVVCFWELG